MERIPLPVLNVMQYLTPVFTILLAWVLLGERLGWAAGVGALLVLAGVALTTKRASPPRVRTPGSAR
jgi:drug/metabolite transporter (DMT)-like permease